MSHLGEQLKKFREALGLSQRKLAKRADLSNDYISKIELGKAENVGVVTLGKIAKALGMDVLELQRLSLNGGKGSGSRVKEASPAYGKSDTETKMLLKRWHSLSASDRKILLNLADQLASRQ